ncbi:MAG: hypothetical protein V3S98_08005 [Dehalococcoidia bacterium]
MRHLRVPPLSLLALAAIIAMAAILARWDSVSATSFDPEGSACLDDFDTIDPCRFRIPRVRRQRAICIP